MEEKYFFFKYMLNKVVKMECGTNKDIIKNLRDNICIKYRVDVSNMPIYQVDEIPVFNKIVNPVKIA